ncbi:hypothetical protein IJ556_03190 [bacterium]|nr:hypothetical protein [bacterium]
MEANKKKDVSADMVRQIAEFFEKNRKNSQTMFEFAACGCGSDCGNDSCGCGGE